MDTKSKRIADAVGAALPSFPPNACFGFVSVIAGKMLELIETRGLEKTAAIEALDIWHYHSERIAKGDSFGSEYYPRYRSAHEAFANAESEYKSSSNSELNRDFYWAASNVKAALVSGHSHSASAALEIKKLASRVMGVQELTDSQFVDVLTGAHVDFKRDEAAFNWLQSCLSAFTDAVADGSIEATTNTVDWWYDRDA